MDNCSNCNRIVHVFSVRRRGNGRGLRQGRISPAPATPPKRLHAPVDQRRA